MPRRRWPIVGGAIAASLVRPNEKVLSISGDGGFLFSANELETAVRLHAHIVHMIWIDGSYDMVAAQEQMMLLGRKTALEGLATFLLGRADRRILSMSRWS